MTLGNIAPASRTEASGGRQWGKTAQTQAQILRAAEEVFVEHGYTNATIADVIERAGSSVGSIYHHFGGKAELYIALWTDFSRRLERAAAEAVAQARKDGETDPITLFELGGAGYLRGIWRARRAATIFWNGDGPPGFEDQRRTRGRAWVENNIKLLGLSKSAEDRFVASVFTALMGEAARSICRCKRSKQADEISAEALRIARLIHENR